MVKLTCLKKIRNIRRREKFYEFFKDISWGFRNKHGWPKYFNFRYYISKFNTITLSNSYLKKNNKDIKHYLTIFFDRIGVVRLRCWMRGYKYNRR